MKRIIYGCEAREDAHTPYLTRWTLLKLEKLKIYFHKFHRSDSDELHDHPWHFISIILWRGYMEETFLENPVHPKIENALQSLYVMGHGPGKADYRIIDRVPVDEMPRKKKRIWPGMIIYRKATHAHRVELLNGKPAYTLVFVFKYVRQWGFFTKWAWQQWTNYFTERGC